MFKHILQIFFKQFTKSSSFSKFSILISIQNESSILATRLKTSYRTFFSHKNCADPKARAQKLDVESSKFGGSSWPEIKLALPSYGL